MFAWGFILIVIGALSFVLPMLDRQFIIVSLLGLSGAGSSVIGLVFVGVGGVLLHLGREQEKNEAAEPLFSGGGVNSQEAQSMMSQKTLLPIDIGRTLALSLDISCNINAISQEEQNLLNQANIPKEIYNAEKTLLSAFAQHSTIFTAIRNEQVREQMLSGYMEVWEGFGKTSSYGALLYQNFHARCQAYAAAIRIGGQGAISPIALEFGRCLGENNGVAQVLALTFADITYQSHVDGTLKLVIEGMG